MNLCAFTFLIARAHSYIPVNNEVEQGRIMKLRVFRTEDMERVLQLANAYAAFDGTTSEADLVITKYFPNGFWVAEEDDRVVGYAYGYFKDVPAEVLERMHAGCSRSTFTPFATGKPQWNTTKPGTSFTSCKY